MLSGGGFGVASRIRAFLAISGTQKGMAHRRPARHRLVTFKTNAAS